MHTPGALDTIYRAPFWGSPEYAQALGCAIEWLAPLEPEGAYRAGIPKWVSAMVARDARAAFVRLSQEDVELAKELPAESFSVLWRASQYAQNARCGVWHFAVAAAQLLQAGLSECDLKWLACKGYVEHSLESSPLRATRQQFDSTPPGHFAQHTTFVLTPRGQVLARSLLTGSAAADAPSATDTATTKLMVCPAALPTWDHKRRELRIGRTVVKRFCVPAENQETILSAFEEEAWAVHIDDPLPPAAGIDPKRRLHSTIQCLNRNQRAHLLNFHGDGTGCGVRWELLSYPARA